MSDILLTEEIEDPSIEELGTRYSIRNAPGLWRDPAALKAAVAEARAVLVRNMTRVDRELVEGAPHLQVVGRIGVGLDNLDLPALSENGIVVCYPPEENAVSVAEHVMGLMLGLARLIPAADRSVRAGRWERSNFIGFELQGKTLGVLGMGRIGFRVAMRARAFGMNVIAYDPYLVAQSPAITETGARLLPLEALLAEADVVTCHLPLTPMTRGMMNRERLLGMRATAMLINTSRGPVVDEEALVQVLESGHLWGAALDVRTVEPPVVGRLEQLDNVLLTPHIASWTRESLHRVISTVAADVDRVLSGGAARNFANFDRPRKR